MNKMTANELRIGNLIFSPLNKKDYAISQSNLCDFANGFIHIEPIPLTEECLLEFGFEQCGYEMLSWQHPKLPGFELDGINWADAGHIEYQFLNYQIGDSIFRIHYIHQLQNLYFALTGEELKQQEQ